MKATMSYELPNGPERELLATVERKLKDEPRLQYGEALKLVAHENPDLAARYYNNLYGRMRAPGGCADNAVSHGTSPTSETEPADMRESVQLSECPRFVTSLGRVRLSEADQPSRVPLAMIGTFYKGKQKFSITRADIQLMAENFAKRGTGDIVLDYEHASEDPEVAQGGPVPAAGWIISIDPEPDSNGIVWGSVKFTQKARDLVAAKEYKYISPVINWGVRDRRTGDVQGATLTSAALTNRPVLDHMPAIQLSDAGWARA
jgi:hypothetical protein